MKELFEEFPYLENEKLIIKKMELSDVDSLSEISHNDNVYKYISPYLYKKSRKTLETAIKNIGGRDFEKKKQIIAGIYPKSEPEKLIGLAEMFDFKKRDNSITVGYRLNESYWHQGFASSALKLMSEYLLNEIGIATLRAFVMPENIYSAKVLLKNGFIKQDETEEAHNWGGLETLYLDVYIKEQQLNSSPVRENFFRRNFVVV